MLIRSDLDRLTEIAILLAETLRTSREASHNEDGRSKELKYAWDIQSLAPVNSIWESGTEWEDLA